MVHYHWVHSSIIALTNASTQIMGIGYSSKHTLLCMDFLLPFCIIYVCISWTILKTILTIIVIIILYLLIMTIVTICECDIRVLYYYCLLLLSLTGYATFTWFGCWSVYNFLITFKSINSFKLHIFIQVLHGNKLIF